MSPAKRNRQTMTRVHPTYPVCVIAATLFAFTTAQAQSSGYWKWVKTDTSIQNGFGSPIHDSATGGETALSITDTAPSINAVFAATFYWNTPPTVLIPGTYLDWRVSGRVDQNSSPASTVHATGDSIQLLTDYCSFSNPTDFGCTERGPGGVTMNQGPGGATWNDPAGTVRTSYNLQQPTHTDGTILAPPIAIPGNNSAALLTFEVYCQVSYGRVWIWHYQYQWVAGSLGSCSGTCTLGSPGQTIDGNGGPGSVSITANGTWDVVAPDNWIQITSPVNGNGNSTVTFTVKPNTGPARMTTILIGGQPFNVSQAAATSTCAGTCSLSSPGQPIAAPGGPATVTVTATSTWTVAAPTDSWVHLTSPASNNGNATVTFTVDANTGPPRSSTTSVANQNFTIYQNGTPASTTTGCAYLIQSSTTQSIPNTGTTSGLIQVVTAQNCAWTSSTSTAWITLKSGTSSTGNGAVAYTVPQNDTGVPRSGAILIAGQYVVVNQAGGTVAPPPGTPVISAGGVVNTASYAPGGPPNGSLAQGSFFSIYGGTVGPAAPVQATTYPLPTTLGAVSVKITQGSNTYNAPLVFVYSTQINAILPSNVPVGAAQLTITYNGLTSQPANITVAKTIFGVFFQRVNGKDLAIAQNVKTATDYPLNLPDTPAKPGQIVIFWGTGLGPITGADNTAPGASAGDMTSLPVTITVGGISAPRLYAGRQSETAGVDNVYFTIPAGVPLGCQVPVVVTAGGVAANTTNIAITADGSPCQ